MFITFNVFRNSNIPYLLFACFLHLLYEDSNLLIRAIAVSRTAVFPYRVRLACCLVWWWMVWRGWPAGLGPPETPRPRHRGSGSCGVCPCRGRAQGCPGTPATWRPCPPSQRCRAPGGAGRSWGSTWLVCRLNSLQRNRGSQHLHRLVHQDKMFFFFQSERHKFGGTEHLCQ